jgi:hypothetical protein
MLEHASYDVKCIVRLKSKRGEAASRPFILNNKEGATLGYLSPLLFASICSHRMSHSLYLCIQDLPPHPSQEWVSLKAVSLARLDRLAVQTALLCQAEPLELFRLASFPNRHSNNFTPASQIPSSIAGILSLASSRRDYRTWDCDLRLYRHFPVPQRDWSCQVSSVAASGRWPVEA